MTFEEFPAEALEETRQFNQAIEELLATMPPVHTVPPAETRAARVEGRGAFPAPVRVDEAEDRTVPGRAGAVRVRQLVPPTVAGVYLHIHGGGWVLGAADQQDLLMKRLADDANVAVVSVDYRLAPEHPYPAGPDDCEDVARWLVENAKHEYGSDRLLIGGESAGAHLAALTLLRLRDADDAARAFYGANLVFGAYDLSMTPSQRLWGERNLILSAPIMQWFYESFLPGVAVEDRRDPAISPLYADLRGMPPALFTVGELDPLLDDSLFMAARWQAAGNEATLRVYPESIHGFTAFPLATGQRCLADQVEFVVSC